MVLFPKLVYNESEILHQIPIKKYSKVIFPIEYGIKKDKLVYNFQFFFSFHILMLYAIGEVGKETILGVNLWPERKNKLSVPVIIVVEEQKKTKSNLWDEKSEFLPHMSSLLARLLNHLRGRSGFSMSLIIPQLFRISQSLVRSSSYFYLLRFFNSVVGILKTFLIVYRRFFTIFYQTEIQLFLGH